MTLSYYEIRLAGISRPAVVDFEGLTAEPEQVATILHGSLPDQAALNGLLARLELLGGAGPGDSPRHESPP